MLEIPIFQSSSYRNTDFLNVKIPRYRQTMRKFPRPQHKMKNRNTVHFFSKYRNIGQKNEPSVTPEKYNPPYILYSFIKRYKSPYYNDT